MCEQTGIAIGKPMHNQTQSCSATSIRIAGADDVTAVVACVNRAYSPWIDIIGATPGPMLDDYGKYVVAGWVHIATIDSTLAGVIVLIPQQDHLLLDNVAVEPLWQSRGLGSQLLDFAESHAREQNFRQIQLYTNAKMAANIALYERRGYVVTNTRLDKGYHRVFMQKSL